ncbi:MAG: hypothetical protein CMH62_00705 [Nanoarchaeota archaeon]|nr:hypothetical protein [Nanoarchaeota archaeon]|tara:strand:- start:2129 stop:2581 length:453 start_codon:yes stop_codon:yes gene_type:complete
MESLKVLNKKRIKEIILKIEEQYNIKDLKLNYVFFQNTKGKVFIVSNEFKGLNFEDLNINSLGLYFANIKDENVRLSIEGSQLIGDKVKKNVVKINDEELRDWLLGDDLIDKEGEGYVLIKNKDDFYGSGRISGNKLLNFVPKEKRINVI